MRMIVVLSICRANGTLLLYDVTCIYYMILFRDRKCKVFRDHCGIIIIIHVFASECKCYEETGKNEQRRIQFK